MTSNWTKQFVTKIKMGWGPLSTEVVVSSRIAMQELSEAARNTGLGEALAGRDASVELYRDAENCFVLTAYAEESGRYRAPHDHGAGWVIYAVAEGIVEMGTYAKNAQGDGDPLVRRDSTRMSAGGVKVFLPGDIHDTLCVSGRAVILRLTSRDLKKEDAEGRMTRYEAPVVISTKRDV